jgi:hypothetical protein
MCTVVRLISRFLYSVGMSNSPDFSIESFLDDDDYNSCFITFDTWKFQRQALTFAMGTHHRLGKGSLVHELVDDVFASVLRFVEPISLPLSEDQWWSLNVVPEDRCGCPSDDSWMGRYAEDCDADGCNLDEHDELDLHYWRFDI